MTQKETSLLLKLVTELVHDSRQIESVLEKIYVSKGKHADILNAKGDVSYFQNVLISTEIIIKNNISISSNTSALFEAGFRSAFSRFESAFCKKNFIEQIQYLDEYHEINNLCASIIYKTVACYKKSREYREDCFYLFVILLEPLNKIKSIKEKLLAVERVTAPDELSDPSKLDKIEGIKKPFTVEVSNEAVADAMQETRDDARKSKVAMAAALEVSDDAIAHYEKMRRTPDFDFVARFFDELGYDAELKLTPKTMT